ncbi:MAG: phosphoglucosamine mutase [Bacteroidales bacterium]|nr:phosphoglucosamine mutase [Bacteroidales bacterium]
MTLIKSISGIRGTIGGKPGENLTPFDITQFATAFSFWIKQKSGKQNPTIVIGRDARISGPMVKMILTATINGMGCNVIDIDMATTPTTEMAVTKHQADGGIIITASHNPKEWNALKLLNEKGEFLSDANGKELLKIIEEQSVSYATVDNLGRTIEDADSLNYHIDKILALPLVDVEAIKKAGFKVAADGINSVGGVAIPELLKRLGVSEITVVNAEPTGNFAHKPEPLPENLQDFLSIVKNNDIDLGIVVDPDVDRLAFVCEDGSFFGEEYTLVAIADYILQNSKGSTVSNLSSSRALRMITEKHGQKNFQSAVGEVNVTTMMKETGAVIGGEGNGGIIYPELHYGRDALVGVALFLSYLAKSGKKVSELRKSYPDFFISKNKVELTSDTELVSVFNRVKSHFPEGKFNEIDGLKVDLPTGWFHLRKSNTEPIIRIYAESNTIEKADALATQVMAILKN